MSDNTEKLSALDRFAVVFTDLMIRLRWLVILAALGGTAWFALGFKDLQYSNNYRVFFSKENPELNAFDEFQQVYSKNDNIFFVLVPKDGSNAFTRDTLKAVQEITEEGWKAPFAQRVDSITNFQNTHAEGDDLIVEDLVGDLDELSDDEIAAKEKIAEAEPLLYGALLSKDRKAVAVNVVFNYPEISLNEVPQAVAYARALRDKIEAEHPGIDVFLSGTTMLNTAFSEASVDDYKLLIPAMFLIISLATVVAVRSLGATLSILLIVGLSCVVAMGWAGYSGIKLAGPSPSSPIVILTLAIADSIHILIATRKGMRSGLAKRAALIEAMRINFLAVLLTSITTIVGFLTLNFSDSPPFRDLGNISAVGIAAAWVFSVTLLPALVAVVPLRVKVVEREAERKPLVAYFGDFVADHARVLMVLTGLAGAVLIAQIPKIQLSDNFRTYFDQRIEFRRDTDRVVDHFGFNFVEFNIPAGGPGDVTDPEFLKRLDAFALWVREQPNVTHVFSMSDIMKRLNRNLNADDPAFYRLPEDRELAAQYLLLFELSLPYGLDLTDRIDIDKSRTRVTATLSGNARTPEIRKFLADAKAWFAVNAPQNAGPATGANVMFTFIAKRNIESMIQGTFVAIAAIGLIMIIALRSLSMGLLSLVPNSLPIAGAFGVWALLVGEVGFSVATIASISLGIVIDDTIHFMTKFMRSVREGGLSPRDAVKASFEQVGVPLLINTVILAAGFGVIYFSAFKILSEMGLLTSITIVLALVFDFLFLPGLLLMTAGTGWAKTASKGARNAT